MSLVEESIRHQVFVEGFKNQQEEETLSLVVPILLKVFMDGLNATNASSLRELPWEQARRRIDDMASQLREVGARNVEPFRQQLVDFAGHEYRFQNSSLESNEVSVFQSRPADQVFVQAEETPVASSGENLSTLMLFWTGAMASKTDNLLRRGYANGTSNSDLISQFRGTRARGYKDGLLGAGLRRDIRYSTANAAQHVSAVGRMAAMEDAGVERYEWVSVLDSKTSSTCRALDGDVFKVNKGPLPPIHPNCRSTISPLKQGQKPSRRKNYYEWLQDQPTPFQDEVLGPTRGKLFREGGISPTKFADLQLNRYFKPRTLKEMEQLAPVVFDTAGVEI